jgi:hypothetical protein
MGWAARNKRRKMVDSLTLPEKTRVRLAELYRTQLQAQKDFQGPLLTALEFFDLDPTLNHGINFDTGIITPAPAPTKPELVKEEEAS